MRMSEEGRAAKKSAQLARVKAKEDDLEGYPVLYASQPSEIAKHAEQTAIRQAARLARNALALAAQRAAESSAAHFENRGAPEPTGDMETAPSAAKPPSSVGADLSAGEGS